METGWGIKGAHLNLIKANVKNPSDFTELCIRSHMKSIELLKSKLSVSENACGFFSTRFLSVACYRGVKIPLYSYLLFTMFFVWEYMNRYKI